MEERERRWYEGKYGRHPPNCSCVTCTEKRLQSQKNTPTPEELIEASRRKIMKEKQDKAPRTYTKEKDKYICPHCLEETLSYNEDERLFICSECGRKYALAKIEE